MWIFNFYSLAFLSVFLGQYNTFALQDVTTDLFGSANYGMVAAFGDFNSDKQTDIFVIREQSEVVIFLADSKSPYFKPKVNISKHIFPSNTVVTSVVPGDYDGDSQMDVLITAQINSKSETIFVFWGNNQTLGTALTLNSCKIFNGDMIPDVFGVTNPPFTEVCYLTNRIVVWKNALSSAQHIRMRIPHSNAFIDLNKDFTAGESVMFKQCLTMRNKCKMACIFFFFFMSTKNTFLGSCAQHHIYSYTAPSDLSAIAVPAGTTWHNSCCARFMANASNNEKKLELEDAPALLKSPVWDHYGFPEKYEKVEKQVDKTKAVCQHCEAVLNYASSNTLNLDTHLKKHHLSVTIPTAKKKQQTVQTMLSTSFHQILPSNSERAKAITKSIGVFIAADLRPYSVTGN
uniref:T-cell immunomodulatory protein-like n=1 Tax=Acanthochromis polyacanthus TaxID=80966 RepID=A0A3Q1GP89_9TELE